MTCEALPLALSEQTIRQLDHHENIKKIHCIQLDERDTTARPSTLPFGSRHSSLGTLDCFPTELLLLFMEQLDFRSLSRLLRTSRKAKDTVEGLPAFAEMMQHAPGVLLALAKTNLIRHHPASSLRCVLRSKRCASCFQFGDFLYLPTCDRVCESCLMLNRSFLMTTESLARRCFSLTDEQLSEIPVMHTLPGDYGYWTSKTWSKPLRLVSVKHLKQLALRIHDSSEEKLAELMPMLTMDTDEDDFIWDVYHLRLGPPGCDLNLLGRLPHKLQHSMPTFSYRVEDAFEGMAAILMPFISGSGADHGHFCKGCVELSNACFNTMPPVPEHLIPPELRGNQYFHIVLEAAASRPYAKTDFAEHVKHCYGVRWLLKEWEHASEGGELS